MCMYERRCSIIWFKLYENSKKSYTYTQNLRKINGISLEPTWEPLGPTLLNLYDSGHSQLNL